jgi:FtsP/CotA-like multicopper oxidase with cupredoxin domain
MCTKNTDVGYDPNFCVPMVKIVIDGDGVEDNSLIPAASQVLRESPPYRVESTTKGREFNLEKGGLGGETTWLINGAQFDVNAPLAMPIIGSAETWGINNNGGGIFRRFRTFLGNYVAHCHNLAHEDHNMMFGWTIRKP